jgi:NAD+ synthase
LEKAPTADLIKGQTDEGDWGITIEKADRILVRLIDGWQPSKLVEMGFDARDVANVRKRVGGTHWKRKLPTVAMLSDTAIGEYYLRPVDY